MRSVSYRKTGAAFGTAIELPSEANSAKAARQKIGGATKEKLLDRSHEIYRMRSVAEIVHLHPPVIGAPGAMRPSGSGHIDYMGILGPRASGTHAFAGRCLAFDAKGVTGHGTLVVPKEMPLSHKDHRRSVRDRKRMMDQAALLLRIQKFGGLAAFLCIDAKRERCWIMDRVDLIAAGEDVPFRHRDTDLFPSVPYASTAQLAKGEPPIDYLRVWLGASP